ncbi:AMPQ Aminopeptidase, partial [Polypterus senegalus]
MGTKSGSGFYLSKSTVAFFTLLFAALFIAFTVFAVLYLRRTGFCTLNKEEESDKVKPLNCTVVPTPGRQGIWDHYRLPTSLVPINYQLELWPRFHPESPESTFTGDVNITFQCKNATDVILLHSEQIEVTVVELVRFEIGTEAPQILEVWRSSLYSYLVINLNETLTENSIYVLRVNFSGVIDNSTGGFMKMDYEEDGRNLSVITTQMEPTYARSVFPCFDEPSFKATFDIRLIYLPNYVALSNMPAINTSPISDEDGVIWKVTTFNTTLKMSTYIVAFVICEFSYIEMIEHGNEIRIWARKSAIENGEADYALNITGAIIRHVMDYLNVSYPLTKTELVAVPEFPASGMENWGLIIFHENSLLFDYNSQNEVKLPASVKTIMDKWTMQTGYPVITLNATTGTLSQEPFDAKLRQATSANNTWYVPIEWIKNGSAQPLTWLKSKEERSFSDEEEEKLQMALSLEKSNLHLVIETVSFILEQVQLELRQVLSKIEVSIQENSVKLSTLTDQLEYFKETFTNRIEMAEHLAASAEERAVNVSSECKKLGEKLGDRLAALEDGSRRYNVRIEDLPENRESSNPVKFAAELFSKIIGDDFKAESEIAMAYRVRGSNTVRPRPRSFIVRFERLSFKLEVMALLRNKEDIIYENNHILIFPDFSPATATKRAAFYNIKQRLRQASVKYSLLYLAKLKVEWQGQFYVFASKEAAEKELRKLIPGLF